MTAVTIVPQGVPALPIGASVQVADPFRHAFVPLQTSVTFDTPYAGGTTTSPTSPMTAHFPIRQAKPAPTGDRGFAVTQQPRVSSNAAAEEAFVPLGRGNGKPARPTEEQLPERYRNEPVPRSDAATLTRVQRQMGVTTPARPDMASATAADFTAERYLRDQSMAPRDGWRRIVFWLSGGRLNLVPSPAEMAERELIARAKTPVPGCRSIAVISRKGGVGKTTTTLMLGHTFASLRGDRVVALDGNPDAGSLGYRVRRETAATITNLLADEQMITRYAYIRAYTSQAPTRLEVVASDDDPRITKALGEEDYRRAIALLERHYNLITLDTGTGVLESATRGILPLEPRPTSRACARPHGTPTWKSPPPWPTGS